MLPEPVAVTLQVVDALEQVGAAYVIGGSSASTIHGVVRTTLDTGIVAELSLQQAEPFAGLLAGAFYLDLDTILHAIQQRSSFNLIHLATMFKVDIFVSKGRPFDWQQLHRRQRWIADPVSGRTIYVAAPEDTVLTKLAEKGARAVLRARRFRSFAVGRCGYVPCGSPVRAEPRSPMRSSGSSMPAE